MTKPEAHEFLDAVQQGAWAKTKEITKALYVTGDLTRHRPQDKPAQQLVASRSWPYYANATGQQETA